MTIIYNNNTMNVPIEIVLFLKLLFVISAIIKLFTSGNIPKLKTEVKISRFLYYNASLLLFLYWFNPWRKKICLQGEEKIIVFSFVLIEFIEEIFPNIV
jgi:hypothetical protein